MKRRTSAFTLVELLIAGAMLIVLLGALGSMFVSTLGANRANREATAASGQLRSAIESIQYDVSMAGFRGVDGGAADRHVADGLTISFDASVTSDDDGRRIDALSTRYYETRYTSDGTPTLHDVSYRVSDDRLTRRVGSADDVPVAEGIVGLDLIHYRRSSGSKSSPFAAPPGDLTGIDLRLTYRQGDTVRDEEFSVSLRNHG